MQLHGSQESRGKDKFQQAIACMKSGRGVTDSRDGATRGAQSHRRLRGICAAHDTSPSHEYLLSMLERNRTKQNETVNAVFLESHALLSFRFYGF